MSNKIIDALKNFSLRSLGRQTNPASSGSKGEEQGDAIPLTQKLSDSFPACLSFLSVSDLLKWTEEMTKAVATVYDKAMDKNYLADKIGGGNHRMFDGGHDLAGAWEAAKNAKPDDTFQQEVIAYASGLWKDLTTVKGLPFTTWEPETYNRCAEWVADHIPGATKQWFYDFMSYDAPEILNASLGAASILFFFSQTDRKRVSEIIGSMGIVSVASANPLMGAAVVLCIAYSYFIKKQQIDSERAVVGVGLAGISMCILEALTLPIMVELGIVIAVSTLLRRHIINNQSLLQFIKSKAATIPVPTRVGFPADCATAKD